MDEGEAIQNILFDKTGQKTVPNVFVSGNHVGGCDDTLGKAQKEPDFFSEAVKAAQSEASADSAEVKDDIKYDYDLIVVGGGSGGLAASTGLCYCF